MSMAASLSSSTTSVLSAITSPGPSRSPAANADPARICAQIVNGMGFLGSATVYKSNNYVKGINTAANLWISAAISMAIGAGMWEFAFITAFATAAVLAVNNIYKARLYASMQNKGDDDDSDDPYVDLENLTSHMGTLASINERTDTDSARKRGISNTPEGSYLEMAKLTQSVRDLLAADSDVKSRNSETSAQDEKNLYGKEV